MLLTRIIGCRLREQRVLTLLLVAIVSHGMCTLHQLVTRLYCDVIDEWDITVNTRKAAIQIGGQWVKCKIGRLRIN